MHNNLQNTNKKTVRLLTEINLNIALIKQYFNKGASYKILN